MGACCDADIRKLETPINVQWETEHLNKMFNDFNKGETSSIDDWSRTIVFEKVVSMIASEESGELLKYLQKQQSTSPICFESLRGEQSEIDVEVGEIKLITTMWTPLLYAVALKQFDVVKQIVDNFGCNSYICLKEPVYDSEVDGVVSSNEVEQTDKGRFWNSAIALQLAVQNSDIQTMDYLWNELYYLWDISDLDQLIDCLYNNEFLDALPSILRGKAFKSIILALTFEEQVFFLEKMLFDKFDKDTLFSIATFIDDALSSKEFATQYLYLNLKREFFLKDLLDVCLHNSNHYMIFENGDLFLWLFENLDPSIKRDLTIMEALVKNIIKGDKQVIEIKFAYQEILRCCKLSNMQKLQKLIELAKIFEINQIQDTEGLVLNQFPEFDDMKEINYVNSSSNDDEEGMILKEWNPLHIAIYFNQLKVVRYFCEGMKVNIRQTLKMPGSKNKANLGHLLGQDTPMITFIIECFKKSVLKGIKKDDQVLMYFWENHSSLFGEVDLKILVEQLFLIKKEKLLRTFFFMPTSVYIIKSLPFEKRLIYLRELQFIGYQQLSKDRNGPLLKEDQLSLNEKSPNKSNNDQDSKDNVLNLMNEILCERPYSLYSFFLNFERNLKFTKLSLSKINASDIEELTRCSLERTLNLIHLMKSKERQKKIQNEIEHFSEIKAELKTLVSRIETCPFYENRMKKTQSRITQELFDNDSIQFKQK